MKRIKQVCAIIALALILGTSSTRAGGLECTLNIFTEKWAETRLELFNHSFTAQPVQVVNAKGAGQTLTGTVIHHNKSGTKDEVAYRIVRENGVIKEISLQVNGGVWLPLSEPMAKAIDAHFKGESMPQEKQKEISRAMEKALDGTWQRTAEFLVATIGIRYC